MSKFEILCVTMHQTDFSKIRQMNIASDVVFANQTNHTDYGELLFDEIHKARMISTATRGVGINRNLALMYAQGEICLFADDDVTYCDNMEQIVLDEFQKNPSADVMIFHLETDDPVRKQKKYSKTRRCFRFERMPWGGCRIAFRLSSVQKANICFTTLFGGGALFPSGEDSMWLNSARKSGLNFYVSNQTIGKVSFETSTWFDGDEEKFYFGKGAYYAATHPKTFSIWMTYFLLRTRKSRKMSFSDKIKWMKLGGDGYKNMKPFDEMKRKSGIR